MSVPGKDVISLVASAQHNVLIVAPFMRSGALSRLLDHISPDAKATIVTRWRPADLVAGASDLGVFDLAKSNGVPLYLRHDLHAKFFAGDDKCLIGSANVTDTALGWRTPANLELLTLVDRTQSHIAEFETKLLAGAVRATVLLRDHIRELMGKLQEIPLMPIRDADELAGSQLPPSWIPLTRNPEDLYSVYQKNLDFSRSILATMQRELREIGVISGLDQVSFKAWVATSIGQTPIVCRVIERIENEGQVTEDNLRDLLAELGVETEKYRAQEVLETLKRWLTYFLPTQYETARDSIKLIKAKSL